MEIQSFDSFDDMLAAMAAAEDTANSHLLPAQVALRDRANETVYWVHPVPEHDLIVYGRTPPAEDADLRGRGYLTGMAYSAWEPEGEGGDTHVSQVIPVPPALFTLAQAAGWPTFSNLSEYPLLGAALAMCEDAARTQ